MAGYEDKILEHYRKEAASKGLSKESTMHDEYIREHESRFILKEIDREYEKKEKPLKILEIGCGNGYLLSLLAERYSGCQFWGLEFTRELFELAKSRALKDTTIIEGDCSVRHFDEQSFDIVISERVLINILDNNDKIESLRQIYSALKVKGKYIMVESFNEPLSNLNKARKELAMEEIKPAYHNEYLDEGIIDLLKNSGFKEIEPALPANFLSTHYFLTRILHESVRPKQGQIKNTEFVKFFDEALLPAIGNYSPVLFRVFEKKS